MAKECVGCVHKSDFKAVECGSCMVSYIDGLQQGLPSNFKPKPQTNADRIRAMSDEELAEYLVYHRPYSTESNCLRWLKQPAGE